jgi:hypothetical protein
VSVVCVVGGVVRTDCHTSQTQLFAGSVLVFDVGSCRFNFNLGRG